MKNQIHRHLKILFAAFTLWLLPALSNAQKQPDIPMPRGPVDLSETSNLIIFIVIPAVIIIVFLMYRKKIKRIREEKKERMNNEKKNKES